MLHRITVTIIMATCVSVLTTFGICSQVTAQSNNPATPSPAFAPKQIAGTISDSAPKFSSGGLTVKLVSISKNENSVAISLMVQNNNAYPVLTSTLYPVPFTIVDNKGHHVKAASVSGIPDCYINRLEECLVLGNDQKFRKPEQYLQIDSGSAAIASMIFSGSDMGDTVTVTGGLALFPWAEKDSEELVGKSDQPRKGKAINIAIPLISLK